METKREIFSLRRDVMAEDGRYLPVVYKLEEDRTGNEVFYTVCCYVEGVNLEDRPFDLASQQLLQRNPEEALLIMERLAAAEVMPVHMSEILAEM